MATTPFPGCLSCSNRCLLGSLDLGAGPGVPHEIAGEAPRDVDARASSRSRAGGRPHGPHGATFFIRADRPDCCGAVGTTPAPEDHVRWAPCVANGQPRTPAEVLQRVWWAGDGKGATATDLKLCRRSAPHATRRGRSGQPPNSARTCLSTHNKRLARWFVFKSV